jgi:hypoxanthine phosphoribosyltransferase
MKKIYYSWSDIQGSVIEIARQIQQDAWRPDYIVGITRGGAVPAVMLSQYLGVPMRPLQVSLRDGGDCVSDLGMAEDAFGYVPMEERGTVHIEVSMMPIREDATDPARRKNILIVDDINDTGATIAWIKKDWPSGCLPNSYAWNNIFHNNVRFAVLTNNLASKEDIDYSDKEVNKAEEDCWLVYPWEEFWRG